MFGPLALAIGEFSRTSRLPGIRINRYVRPQRLPANAPGAPYPKPMKVPMGWFLLAKASLGVDLPMKNGDLPINNGDLPEGIWDIQIWVCLKMLGTPLNPMVLLIIIPIKNGYFIGNIPYFQTNPHSSVVETKQI